MSQPASERSHGVRWLAIAIVVASCAAVGGSIWAALAYGGEAFWPGLIGNFGASLAAFVLALWWEGARERRQLIRDASAAKGRIDAEEIELQERRATEVQRRLKSIEKELLRNKKSLESLKKGFDREDELKSNEVQLLHPELLDGAWVANAPRLAELVADYELISDLTSTYGRIEEVRWRVRQRTATFALSAGSEIAADLAGGLTNMTRPLVDELLNEVDGLLVRINAQALDPDVRPFGLVHTAAMTADLRLAGGLDLTKADG